MNRREFLKLGALIPFVLHLPAERQRKITLIGYDGYSNAAMQFTPDQLKILVRRRKEQGKEPIYVYAPIVPEDRHLFLAVELTENRIDKQLEKHEHPILQLCRDMDRYDATVFQFKNGTVFITPPPMYMSQESPLLTRWAGPLVDAV